ncbi:MAG: protein-glutamate O-methyltransferase CheR [Dehalococcoidales bacterium]|nr:protein-glutamate O-methyltransferase CheR [Dehalococcoidales bacterium]
MEEKEYAYAKKKIRELIKVDLDNYGAAQMMRRLDGFVARSKAPNVASYFKLLEKDPEEQVRLRDFLTINVSEFFRDMVHFKVLQEKILPSLLEGNSRLNIWSAGCSHGAEPYSIAMILDRLTPQVRHRILATDIDISILKQAEAGGPYRSAEVRNVAKLFGTKYLVFRDGAYWVSDELRERITFRQHDLTRDPFESGFDLIVCRNVVIYFSDEAKKTLRRRFYNALKPGGILFIGATETILDALELGFQRVCTCFYRKTLPAARKGQTSAVTAELRGV